MRDGDACDGCCEHAHWDETYYGYECRDCGAFVPFGCEPWAPDGDGDDDDTE